MTNVGVGSWPWRRARMAPDALAFRQGDRTLSHGALAQRVEALAAGLAHLGVGRGDRVAHLGANDIATFEFFFAAARLGAVFVPLNTRLSAVEIGYMLGDCTPAVLVHAPEPADLVAAADPESRGVRALPRDPDAIIAAAAGPAPEVAVSLDDDALLLYTSGTTGRPKGAVLTHGNLTFNTMSQLAHVDVLHDDVALCLAPLFHVTGLGLVTLPTLFKGGTVVVAPRFDPAATLRTIAQERITAFSGVPTMLQMLADHPDFAGADLTSLRYVVYGGSPCIEYVARAWQDRGVELLQGYGMTEAAPGIVMAMPGAARDRPTSTGVPHFFVDVRSADGRELLVRGPHLFRGYWQRPEETAAAFDLDGWFRTGDVVATDADGWTAVVGRVKDMIISGGENIYPAEVEAVIAQLPEVAEGAVVGVPDERWGEVGMACVVLRPGAALGEAEVRAHLQSRLARYKVPRDIRFVDHLPRTPSGKVRKAELRAAYVAGERVTG